MTEIDYPGILSGKYDPLTWRPIESAPKDGTDVLICKVYDDGSVSDFEIAGWDDELEWHGLQDITLDKPTHWMPLPSPPTSA